jgi:hypothetical protein
MGVNQEGSQLIQKQEMRMHSITLHTPHPSPLPQGERVRPEGIHPEGDFINPPPPLIGGDEGRVIMLIYLIRLL